MATPFQRQDQSNQMKLNVTLALHGQLFRIPAVCLTPGSLYDNIFQELIDNVEI